MKLIYDGNNTAFRANSVTELYTKDGRRSSAILGVLNIMKKDIEELEKRTKQKVEEIIFVWDLGKSKRRMLLCPEYKGKRKKENPTPDEILWFEEFKTQTNYLHEHLECLGVKSVRIAGWEADDIIKLLTCTMTGDLVVISTDEDMLQLVSQNVTVYSPIKSIMINNVNFSTIIGISQSNFITYKIIKGDDSDNIRGIDGIGEKTGKELVNKYGNLRGIMANKATLMKSKRYEKIFTVDNLRILDRNLKMIDMSYEDHTPIREEVQEIVDASTIVSQSRAMQMLKEYQLTSILTEFKRWITVYQEISERNQG